MLLDTSISGAYQSRALVSTWIQTNRKRYQVQGARAAQLFALFHLAANSSYHKSLECICCIQLFGCHLTGHKLNCIIHDSIFIPEPCFLNLLVEALSCLFMALHMTSSQHFHFPFFATTGLQITIIYLDPLFITLLTMNGLLYWSGSSQTFTFLSYCPPHHPLLIFHNRSFTIGSSLLPWSLTASSPATRKYSPCHLQ